VRGVEVIYHMAWAFYPDDERRELGENVLGTLALLQAALAAGVRHLQFASSAVVYGPTGPARTSEEHPCHPERSSIGGPMYGIAKLACEGLCLAYGRRGLPVTVWRMHGVLSAGRLGPFAPMIAQALRGEPVRAVRGAGGEYVHLADVIRALLLAVRTSSPGEGRACGQVLNLAGTHTYHDPELARYIVETAGSGSRVELVEDPAQGMISLSVDRLRQVLGYEPREGEFLSGLIQSALEREA
jgi:nucleoside-diphosphate-sugar epimerase